MIYVNLPTARLLAWRVSFTFGHDQLPQPVFVGGFTGPHCSLSVISLASFPGRVGEVKGLGSLDGMC